MKFIKHLALDGVHGLANKVSGVVDLASNFNMDSEINAMSVGSCTVLIGLQSMYKRELCVVPMESLGPLCVCPSNSMET